jgi:hypothetical protein
MSKITTVYDTIIAEMIKLFPDKQRISNPYDLSNNSETKLKDSWGIKMSPSGASGINLFPYHTEARDFSIVLCRRVYKLKEDSAALDAPLKALMEDAKTVICRMMAADQLGIPDSVGKIDFASNSGIEFTRADSQESISTEIKFSVDIMEGI